MTIDELVRKIYALQVNPPSDTSVYSELCSNKHILLNDYQAEAALSIDRFDSKHGIVQVFDNTYFRGEADGAEVGLFANSADFPVAISAYGITVEDAAFTVSERSDDSVRVGAVAIYGQDVTIRNTSLESNLNPSSGINKERTGISIQKGDTTACGTNPEFPKNVLIEDTVISGFDISVNISAFATLRRVTFDSPIIIAIADMARLDEIVIEDPISLVSEGPDVFVIVSSEDDMTNSNVLELEARLEGEGLEVKVEAIEVEIGDVTISPWEEGGSFEVVAT